MEFLTGLLPLLLLLTALLCLGFGAWMSIRRGRTRFAMVLNQSTPRQYQNVKALVFPVQQPLQRHPTCRMHFCLACGKAIKHGQEWQCDFCGADLMPHGTEKKARGRIVAATRRLPDQHVWATK